MLMRAVVIAALISLVRAGQVRAQTPEEAALLRITREQFESHAAALEFTVAQRDAAEAMFVEYEREFDDAWKAETAIVEWLWSNTSSGSWWGGESVEAFSDTVSREVRSLEEQWQRGARALEARYFERLATIAIGREETVPSLRRSRLRERMLTPIRMRDSSGATVNLIAQVASLDAEWASNPAVQEVLHEYELALDQALLARDESALTRRQRIDGARREAHAAQAAGRDPTRARLEQADAIIEFTRMNNALWQLQASAADRIATLVPAEKRPAFDDAIHLGLHPYLKPHQGTTPEQAFDDALRRTDLSQGQIARLEDLRSTWRTQRAAAVPALHRAYLQQSDPEADRETYLLYFSGQNKEVYERVQAAEEAWNRAKRPWLAKCEQTVAEIARILADAPEKPTP